MTFILRAGVSASVLALTLGSTPGIAAGYEPSAAEVKLLHDLDGATWRTNDGYQGSGKVLGEGGYKIMANGVAGERKTEELFGRYESPGKLTGYLASWADGSSLDDGAASFTLGPDRISGTLVSKRGNRDFLACLVTGSTRYPSATAGWLWLARVSVQRDGGRVSATFDVQSSATESRSLNLLTFDASWTATDGQVVHANRPSREGAAFVARQTIGSCETQRYTIDFGAVPLALSTLELKLDGTRVAFWDAPVAAAEPGTSPAPSPDPGPAPSPPPPPPPPAPSPNPPSPTPMPAPPPQTPAPAPSPSPGSGGVPSGAGSWQLYGSIWSFKVDELVQGPDGHWQAIVSVRDESTDRVGMTASEIEAFLINEDGETIRQTGNLYRPSVTGPVASLERLTGTQWMEKGDTIRVRLVWDQSKDLHPIKLRVRDSGHDPVIREFPLR